MMRVRTGETDQLAQGVHMGPHQLVHFAYATRIVQRIDESLRKKATPDPVDLAESKGDADIAAIISQLETEMLQAAEAMDFERAAMLRDQLFRIKGVKKDAAKKKKSALPK